MELLEVHQLTRYQRGKPLFQPLDLRLTAGTRLGVVGPNGSGKSTLLRLLAGVETPDQGRVSRGPGVRLAHLPQRPTPAGPATVWDVAAIGLDAVRAAEARLRDEERRLARGEPREQALAEALDTFEALGAYRAEAELRQMLAALGFTAADHGRAAASLSSGERRRLELAAALGGAPQLLLLDEPTNHLDIGARSWLGERLARWPGAVVLVSHDRALLDRATNATLFLTGDVAELRRGGYQRARLAREHDLTSLRRRDAERRKEARRLRAMSEALARRGNRGAARRRRAADRRAAALAALEADLDPGATGERADPSLPSRGLAGVHLEARALVRDGIVSVPFLRLPAGRHVALLGPNGSGKSTLLGLLAGTLPSDDPRSELRYAPRLRLAAMTQLERGLVDGEPLLAQLERVATRARARELLAEAGMGPALWERPPERLSGGERARAGLALLEAREADLLLLDEPSNDLDLPAIEALEEALRDTQATVVLATHDRRLAERVADEVWSLDGGDVRVYHDVASFLSGAASVSPQATAGVPSPPGVAGQADMPVGPPAGEGDAAAGLDALEDEARAVEQLLEDPLALAPRVRERLQARRTALQEELALAYDARFEPPEPRFRVREAGLTIVGDRHGDGLLTMAVADAAAPRAMAALLRLASGADTGADQAVVGAWPWARVVQVGAVAHVGLVETVDACLLPWARAALVDGTARLAFTLLDVTALQLFTRQQLAGTALQDAGGGWWTWTRDGFARREGLPGAAGARHTPRRIGADPREPRPS